MPTRRSKFTSSGPTAAHLRSPKAFAEYAVSKDGKKELRAVLDMDPHDWPSAGPPDSLAACVLLQAQRRTIKGVTTADRRKLMRALAYGRKLTKKQKAAAVDMLDYYKSKKQNHIAGSIMVLLEQYK